MRRIKITRMALGLKIYLPSDHFNIFPVKQPCYKGAWNPISQRVSVLLQRAFSTQSYLLLQRADTLLAADIQMSNYAN